MDLRNFGQAIRELADEKGVAEGKVVETIELAIAAAYKKDYGKKGQIIRARFNPATGELRFSQIKIVLDETMIKSEAELDAEETVRLTATATTAGGPQPAARETEEGEEQAAPDDEAEVKRVRFNPERHIMFEEARAIKPDVQVGEELEFPLEERREFGRIASQTAKQVIIQRIREAEREATYSEYKTKEGEITSGIVQRIEGRSVYLDLGRGVGILPAEEQIPRERYAIGERLKTLVLVVEKDSRGPGIFLSRSHPRFLKKLFELEVPEIASGVVEIKAMAREPGLRSKVAVASNDPAVDPVGSMVGQRGVRVSTVINEIGGEKIDIIEWSEDSEQFIANALSPAKVLGVETDAARASAQVTVPDDQLSLAIGKGGQNVRLAAKLTGWRIDVRSRSGETPTEAARPPESEAVAAETPPAPVAPDATAEAEAMQPAHDISAEPTATIEAQAEASAEVPATGPPTAAEKTATAAKPTKKKRKSKKAE